MSTMFTKNGEKRLPSIIIHPFLFKHRNVYREKSLIKNTYFTVAYTFCQQIVV